VTKRAAGLSSILPHSFFPTFNMAKDVTSLLDEHTMETPVELLKGNAATSSDLHWRDGFEGMSKDYIVFCSNCS